jgi:hypothetical protein
MGNEGSRTPVSPCRFVTIVLARICNLHTRELSVQIANLREQELQICISNQAQGPEHFSLEFDDQS